MEWLIVILFFGAFIFFGALMGFRTNSRARELEVSLRSLEYQMSNLRQEVLSLRTDGLKPPEPETSAKKAQAAEKPKTPAKTSPNPEPIAEPKPEPEMAASATASPSISAPLHTDWRRPDESPASKLRSRKPRPEKRNMEFEFGAKWSVWVGGLALLFGAVFLLRYSIEAGFFSPAMRVGMAAVLGLALLAGGEWLRRGDSLPKLADGKTPEFFQNSYIPGVLTAVGIFTLLGTAFAAHELYGFIGASTAFILMGIISLAALALGLLHGPFISALGLLAAFVTPLLIDTEAPSVIGLFGYLTFISLSAWTLTRLRNWQWLGLATIIAGGLWLALTMDAVQPGQNLIIWMGYFALVFAANHFLASRQATLKTGAPLTAIDHSASLAIILNIFLAIIAMVAILELPHGNSAFVVGTGIVAAFSLTPFYKNAFTPNFWLAGILAAAIILDSRHNSIEKSLILTGVFAGIGFIYYLLNNANEAAKIGFWTKLKPPAIFPLFILLASAAPNNQVGMNILGCAALLLMGAFILERRQKENILPANYLVGSAIALFIGILLTFKMPWEIAALSGGIIAFTVLSQVLRSPAARWLAFAFSLITLVLVLRFTLGEQGSVGESFPLNELWLYLALPSAISFGAGWFLRRSDNDTPSEGLLALGLAFGLLFVLFQIRHFMTDGNIYSERFTFDEMGLYVSTGLIMTLARRYLGIGALTAGLNPALSMGGAKSSLKDAAIPGILSLVSWITLGVFAVFVCFLLAPLLNNHSEVAGSLFANTLMSGYLIPVLLMGALLWVKRKEPANFYSNALRGLAILGFMLFVTSQIRFGFMGEDISLFEYFPKGLETYVITASWLLIGVLALTLGIKFDRKALRLGSGLIVILTVFKAFLVDMSTLQGVLRAISFVILGLVLIVIGRVYQKLLFEKQS